MLRYCLLIRLCNQINGELVTSMSQKDAVSLVKRMGNSVTLAVWP